MRAVWTGVLVAVLALCAQSPAPAVEGEPVAATGWDPPVLISDVHSQREAGIALSPTDPDLLVTCSPSGAPNVAYGQSFFHRSSDAGQTWEFLEVEGGTEDTRSLAFEGGDCDVAFDTAGTLYTADLGENGISVGSSRDGGDTWEGTALTSTTVVPDRPWLVGGPPGTVYMSFSDLQCCLVSAIFFTKSTDYGKTFAPPVLVTSANASGAFAWEGNLAASADGKDLYLVYTRRDLPALGPPIPEGSETVEVAASHDGGATWTSHIVASMPNPASYLYPSVALDGRGDLHVVFSSRRQGDQPVWYTASGDDGRTWRPPIPLTTGGQGYSPWVAADEDGMAAVAWYGSADPPGTPSPRWTIWSARVSGGLTANPAVTAEPTTTTPLYVGESAIPEFETVRLDDDGRMHIAAAVHHPQNELFGFATYYQRESPPLPQ